MATRRSDPDADLGRAFARSAEALVVLRPDGRLVRASDRVGVLLRCPVDDVVGRDVADLVAVGDRAVVADLLSGAGPVDAEFVLEHDLTVMPATGPPFRARVRAVRMDDAHVQWSVRHLGGGPATMDELETALVMERNEAAYLRELDRWRTAFKAAAAHDLRSPLAGIRAFAETMRERHDDLDDEQRRHFLGRIMQTCDRLTRLLEDLLDLHRATRDAVRPHRETVDLGQLVTDAVGELSPRGRVLEVDVRVPDLQVPLDPMRMAQVVTNLVDNALHHTPEGCHVRVRVGCDDVEAWVVVEDDGPGLPVEVVDRLFVPFVSYPVNPDNTHGSGLGLSLVKLFVELQGGTVHHEPTHADERGAKFVVRVPLGP